MMMRIDAMRQRTRQFRPVSTRGQFTLRLARNALLSGGLVSCSPGIGAVGYHELVDLDWLDATLTASMILTGMGPLAPLTTVKAKRFGISCSLFSGVAFPVSVAVGFGFGPLLQRFLLCFHLDAFEETPEPRSRVATGHRMARVRHSPRPRLSPC